MKHDGWPVLLLRALLWTGVVLALVTTLGVGWTLLQTSPDDSPTTTDLSLSGFGAAALVGLLSMVPILLLTAVPLLMALRRGSARWAWFGLIALTVLGVVLPAVFLADARESADCGEGKTAFYVVPSWPLLLLVLATTASARTALGLASSARARALAQLVRAGLAAVALLETSALLLSRHPASTAISALASSPHQRELRPLLEPHCSISAHPDRMRADCRAVVPGALRCALLPAQVVTIELDADSRLRRWRRHWTLAGASSRGTAR